MKGLEAKKPPASFFVYNFFIKMHYSGGVMNRKLLAQELIIVAKDILAWEFETDAAYEKYKQQHPGADDSIHYVNDKNDIEPKEEKVQKKETFVKKVITELSN